MVNLFHWKQKKSFHFVLLCWFQGKSVVVTWPLVMWPCVLSWRNTEHNYRAYQFSNSPIVSKMLLVLTNICRGGDITSVTRCGADPETITSPLMFSDSPNSGLRIVYPSLLTVFRNQDVWKTRGDLRQQGGLPDWPGPWWGDQDIRFVCCGHIYHFRDQVPALFWWFPNQDDYQPPPPADESVAEKLERISNTLKVLSPSFDLRMSIYWSPISHYPYHTKHPDCTRHSTFWGLRDLLLSQNCIATYKFQVVPKEKFILGCKHFPFSISRFVYTFNLCNYSPLPFCILLFLCSLLPFPGKLT